MSQVKLLLHLKSFKHICRTCLSSDLIQPLFPIGDIMQAHIDLKQVLDKWISFQEPYESELPQQICKSCLMWATKINYFVKRMREADLLLQNVIFKETKQDNPKKEEENNDTDFHNDSSFCDDTNEDLVQKIEEQEQCQENLSLKARVQKFKQMRKKSSLKKCSTMHEEDFSNSGDKLIFFCGICDSGFKSHEGFQTHRKQNKHWKGGSAYYICPTCDERLTLYSKLKEHLVRHSGQKPNTCPFCMKGFRIKSDLTRHVKYVHLKKQKRKCKYCYKVFSDPDKRSEHEKIHDSISYGCSICGKSFKNYQSRAIHERNHKRDGLRKKYEYKQTKTHEFCCSDCGKIYYTKQGFDEHRKEHEGLTFPCDVCQKEFPTEGKMSRHKDFVHTEAKYSCDICGHVVKQKAILDNHMKNYHLNQKTEYKCEYCEKIFFNKNSLRQHTRIHTNDVTYQCHICQKICTNSRNLNAHIRTHTGEKPFQCVHCDRKFANKDNMRVHMKSHEGPKKYQCVLCLWAFYTNSLLRKHMRTVHNQEQTPEQKENALKNFEFIKIEIDPN